MCRRLSGAGDAAGAIFRLDTSYGGGKTHGLIALAHAARGMTGVAEFVDPALVPAGPVRVAAFDGEKRRSHERSGVGRRSAGLHAVGRDRPRSGRQAGLRAGAAERRAARGARVGDAARPVRRRAGVDPARRAVRLSPQGRPLRRRARRAFLTSVFKPSSPRRTAALVYTLAIGKDGRATDACSTENQFVADRMAEIESVSARKATLLNPTEEDETVQVPPAAPVRAHRRRPGRRGRRCVPRAVDRPSGRARRDAARPETVDQFRASYPLHPHVLDTLTGKTATLANFQRVRGMLRLLARTVAHLWRSARRTRWQSIFTTSIPASSRSGRRS